MSVFGNNNQPKSVSYDNSYIRTAHTMIEEDGITFDITKLKSYFFLEGPNAIQKSMDSIDLLLAKYGNGNQI